MYKYIKIKKFKGFQEFAMVNMSRINLIAGVNNVGKTAFLEAMFLHCGAYNPTLTLTLDSFRGLDKIHVEFSGLERSPWDSLFNKFDKSEKIEIEGGFMEGSVRKISLQVVHPSDELIEKDSVIKYGISTRRNLSLDTKNAILLKLKYEESSGKKSSKKKTGTSLLRIGPDGVSAPITKSPPFPAIFLPARFRIPPEEDAKRFSNLEVFDQQNMLLDVLKLIEPRLKRIAVVATGAAPILYGDIGFSQMLQLPNMGDGMSKLASVILAIGNAPGGVVLVDEIENGFHHTMMQKVWSAIGRAARNFDTQIFATTHSLECITAAHRAFNQEENYDLLVHRLKRVNEAVTDVIFNKSDLDAALELKMDVR
ncbi:MAG TPA: ATP-binding protein [Methanocellales archaeon]|nr:ATP-binding protein [Methanocellales archaeon]